ncbi:hypothetical protein Ab1vBOLIVR2_gp01 [Agrobacterium phage OLIVR2]|uniref:Uncharacterized protein n=1 Tax=Agrobacterium phage OLIVR1 TaxID=2723769 RepID=A0A858MQZ1_9CAUD|nr:hypothetical protein KNU98_gp108 [Agrobacterium phage OLIVR1]QIW87196.1 hypothetical protein Ab1vBOLIVR1_gp01 [Agrobacterium phage OLIVR1]QIW87304.1 hypothetical protein Ab1vBOLIVR2_gp01 [Agrobacterium phage OLIVR2]QIW87411.1 hypothetical protein Ab1vBOLIVR3_gp01 [Agrobacterium phage OLIVR3]
MGTKKLNPFVDDKGLGSLNFSETYRGFVTVTL